jgi:hypothetical protein
VPAVNARGLLLGDAALPGAVLQVLQPIARVIVGLRVLTQHSYEVTDLVVAAEAGEDGDGGLDHALGLGDHDRSAPERRQPVPLAGVVRLDAVGLFLADIEPALWDGLLVGGPVVAAVETRVPLLLYPGKQPIERGPVTTAEFPVNQSA